MTYLDDWDINVINVSFTIRLIGKIIDMPDVITIGIWKYKL